MICKEAVGNKQNSLPLAMRSAAAVDVDTFILWGWFPSKEDGCVQKLNTYAPGGKNSQSSQGRFICLLLLILAWKLRFSVKIFDLPILFLSLFLRYNGCVNSLERLCNSQVCVSLRTFIEMEGNKWTNETFSEKNENIDISKSFNTDFPSYKDSRCILNNSCFFKKDFFQISLDHCSDSINDHS